jgi:DNA-binding response OmpR family regulator
MKVLLVEDEPDIRLIARLALRRSGFDVTVAENGIVALEKAIEIRPDVILLDWMMPELDGPETCARLKANPATAHVPVIFLTAKSQESEIQRGLALGAIGYITKPFDVATLGDHVRRALEK